MGSPREVTHVHANYLVAVPAGIDVDRPACRGLLLARYSGRTHHLYQFQLREWFAWCERNGLDPLVGVQRAHVELYIRSLGERPDGLKRGVDAVQRPRLLQVRAHRRSHPG